MYISASQIVLSLERLKGLHPFFGFAFLGFKKAELPVGVAIPFNYNSIREEVLEPYFRPIQSHPGFFNPFKSTKLWVSPRYDTTSLQRIVADTFGAAFMHRKGSGHWGWNSDYVEILKALMLRHQSIQIPAFDLAVWLYRNDRNIPNESEAFGYLVQRFLTEFNITEKEANTLFIPWRARGVTLAPDVPDLNEVWNVIGWPDGFRDEEGIVLDYLNLMNVGPARDLGYFPRDRLNVLTGDNSLGKTFLLDCVWWAATGCWPRHEAEPRRSGRAKRSEIAYGVRSHSGRVTGTEAPYNRVDEDWQRPLDQHEGLGIYATHSGAFALWDPVRPPNEPKSITEWTTHLVLTRDQVWEGFAKGDRRDRRVQISNGLIRDWATWQTSRERYGPILRAFERCLRDLSPPEGPALKPGSLTRIASDSREFPSIRMPYGDVPIVFASAGVQRIISLAYVLVWHWREHLARCERSRRSPFKRMILLVDEVEAHLHPRWQRQILPALLRTLRTVAPDLAVQVHVATHSPLVLASLEPELKLELDGIHHLILKGDDVELQEINVFKHGTVDSWLESEIFGLSAARSVEGERAIERAKTLQLKQRPSQKEIRTVHQQLLKLLPDDDTFWVRWLYFAEQLGAIKGPKRDKNRSRG